MDYEEFERIHECGLSDLWGEFETIMDKLKALQESTAWIPVSERLPEIDTPF